MVQWKHSYPTVEDPNHVNPTINTYAEHPVITQTADQGYVLAGSYLQIWLFKVNSQGSVRWSKTCTLNDESSGNGELYYIIQTIDKGFAFGSLAACFGVGAFIGDFIGRLRNYEGPEQYQL